MGDTVLAKYNIERGFFAARVASVADDKEHEVTDPIQAIAVREMWKRGLRDIRIGIPSNYGRTNGVAGFIGDDIKMVVEISEALPWEREVR